MSGTFFRSQLLGLAFTHIWTLWLVVVGSLSYLIMGENFQDYS